MFKKISKAFRKALKAIKSFVKKMIAVIKDALSAIWSFIKDNLLIVLLIILVVIVVFFPLLIPMLLSALAWVGNAIIAAAVWLGPGWSIVLGLGVLKMVSPETADKVVGVIGEIVGGGVGAVADGVFSALTSAGPFGIILIVAVGLWGFSKIMPNGLSGTKTKET